MRLLILGGYGTFGGRIIGLVGDRKAHDIFVAGRSLAKAEAFCAARHGVCAARLRPLELDRADIKAALASLDVDLLVDASGPFQDYGADDYAVVRACIDAGVHYLDLADCAEFVVGIERFDDEARSAGVSVLSGVSSYPVLTAAVVADLAEGLDVKTVSGGIAPSPHARFGMNVMRAVLTYAGAPIALTRRGVSHTAYGLTESRYNTIAPPGGLPLRSRRFSLVEVPDHLLLPVLWPSLETVWLGASARPTWLLRVLNGLSQFRATFNTPSMARFAPLFYAVHDRLRFGADRGGMFVQVTGIDTDGTQQDRSWHLTAEGADGPLIPAMAVSLLIGQWIDGSPPPAGARAAAGALTLADYDRAFEGRAIRHGVRRWGEARSLYELLLGSALERVPDPVRAFHGRDAPSHWSGVARVTRGSGTLGKVVAKLFGFPEAGDGVSVSVVVERDGFEELWTRDFGGRVFSSVQRPGTGRSAYLLQERFGAITVDMAVVERGDGLQLVPRAWRIWRIPLPRFLLPSDQSFERSVDGAFAFDVEIRLPVVGLVVAYAGTLSPEP